VHSSGAVLDEMAASEDGEEVASSALQGLHAKAFIAEIGWDTLVTIGSGNATRPALLSGNNVELFASLRGKRSKVGSIEQIMGEKGFGRLARTFVASELDPIDSALTAAEAHLDEGRRILCRGALRLRCERTESDDPEERPWRVWLTPSGPLPLKGIGALSVWPITRGDGHARDVLVELRSGQTVDLGAMPMVDLTRFLACRLTDESKRASALFSTGLIMEGLPAERHAAILRWIIDSRDAFFRYLRLLLCELGDPFGAALAAHEQQADWQAAGKTVSRLRRRSKTRSDHHGRIPMISGSAPWRNRRSDTGPRAFRLFRPKRSLRENPAVVGYTLSHADAVWGRTR
jgi:hypothetical protein